MLELNNFKRVLKINSVHNRIPRFLFYMRERIQITRENGAVPEPIGAEQHTMQKSGTAGAARGPRTLRPIPRRQKGRAPGPRTGAHQIFFQNVAAFTVQLQDRKFTNVLFFKLFPGNT
jgi:hypothetical protein